MEGEQAQGAEGVGIECLLLCCGGEGVGYGGPAGREVGRGGAGSGEIESGEEPGAECFGLSEPRLNLGHKGRGVFIGAECGGGILELGKLAAEGGAVGVGEGKRIGHARHLP